MNNEIGHQTDAPDRRVVICDNCEWKGIAQDLDNISVDGLCPLCGADDIIIEELTFSFSGEE